LPGETIPTISELATQETATQETEPQQVGGVLGAHDPRDILSSHSWIESSSGKSRSDVRGKHRARQSETEEIIPDVLTI
jgi:hypothetical protein